MRFVIHNRGQLVHEFNIGTPHMHREHQEEMLEMMQSGAYSPTKMGHGHDAMKHGHANAMMLDPRQSGELIWKFGMTDRTLEFACNVPGHYPAGMHGRLEVVQ